MDLLQFYSSRISRISSVSFLVYYNIISEKLGWIQDPIYTVKQSQ